MDSRLLKSTPPAPDASLALPISPIADDESTENHASPFDPLSVPPLFYIHKNAPKTVTQTISITISEFYVSFATESQLLTLTDTVYVNKTVFNYVTLTHTDHTTHTINNTVPTTVFATTTLLPASTTKSAALAQATLRPDVSVQKGGGHLKPVAIVFVVLGAVVGLVVVVGVVWFAVRRYRGWKAKGNQRMRGVELQREWEREQEDRRARREMGEVHGGA
ncbi:MAG: hypothetical protein LQ343_007785 [Gyalolechia ehrenbergii]|nr:MAG: hypothetical protein LQ343_007785 [Gyalolechia ehrenbergii]